MGIRSFNRWLADKYPKVFVTAAADDTAGGSAANPNGMEFDNLYLDMNRVIHPCFNTDDNLFPPITFGEVFNNMVKYIDRVFRIVRPRKLLFIAIDGVSPRAKMNQQRARRFGCAKDRELLEKEEERLRKQYQMEGKHVLPKVKSEVSDSNIVTPGTKFMFRMSEALQAYIRRRMDNDPGWKGIKIILSNANVPGEGEHKIISFIRIQRTFPDYNPDTRHCLYGLDADLIILALATHELHVSILREEVLNLQVARKSFAKSEDWFEQVLEESHNELSCSEICSIYRRKPLAKKPYLFLHVWILREYLEHDLKIPSPPEGFEADLDRIIDDFIFICFFAGNDILPNLPTVEIHEGGIDLLMHVYKEKFKNLGGYLVDMKKVDDKNGGFINLRRVEKFILSIGTYEEAIFKKRSELRKKKHRHSVADCAIEHDEETEAIPDISSAVERLPADNREILQNTIELKKKLMNYRRKMSDICTDRLTEDKVRFGEAGWKERFYKEKLSAENQEEIEYWRKNLVEKFIEGLCWVLLYYFSGVPSWTWFYPFHYGPFASDLKGLAITKLAFEPGLPLKPFDQLMAVLPPKSAHALPQSYRTLVIDEKSSISDLYPSDFEVDCDGKRYASQGICKLNFIDVERLLTETKKLEKALTEEESIRNAEGYDLLFMHNSSPLGSMVASLYKNQASMDQNHSIKIESDRSNAINGFISLKFDGNGFSEYSNAICVSFRPPPLCSHSPTLLQGVIKAEERTVHESDIRQTLLWHEYKGSRPSYSFRCLTTDWKQSTNSMDRIPEVETKRAAPEWRLGRGRIQGPLPCNVSTRESDISNSSSRWGAVGVDGLIHGSNYHGRDHTQNGNITSFRPYDGGHAWLERTRPSGSNSYQNSRHSSYAPGHPDYCRWQIESHPQNIDDRLSERRSSSWPDQGHGTGDYVANQSDRGRYAFGFDGEYEHEDISKLRISGSTPGSNSYGRYRTHSDNNTSLRPYGRGRAWSETTRPYGTISYQNSRHLSYTGQPNNNRWRGNSSSTWVRGRGSNTSRQSGRGWDSGRDERSRW